MHPSAHLGRQATTGTPGSRGTAKSVTSVNTKSVTCITMPELPYNLNRYLLQSLDCDFPTTEVVWYNVLTQLNSCDSCYITKS